MKIKLKHIPVRDIVDQYIDNANQGVTGYKGKLNIRPSYQREFVYKDKQRDAVIDTVRAGLPLNVLYWVKNPDSTFEVLDGQQRTISLCEYVQGKFTIDFQYFHNLDKAEQDQILDYELMIYFCEGTNTEKLEWFKTINIAGEKLTNQELRNAIYTGPWLNEAKKYFSKPGCPAYTIAGDYLRGSAIRQDYLETAMSWHSDKGIEEYMADNQHEPNANELWLYFKSVINWVKTIFPNYRKEMKSIPWGELYNEFKDSKLDATQLENRIKILMQDEDVTKKSGIYSYLLNGEERHLNIRAFSPKQKRERYEAQQGICPICTEHFELNKMDADHINPWHDGGKTEINNCQMLCSSCNRSKGKK